MWGCPCSHCCSMASLCSSADWACMACSWWAADMGVGWPWCWCLWGRGKPAKHQTASARQGQGSGQDEAAKEVRSGESLLRGGSRGHLLGRDQQSRAFGEKEVRCLRNTPISLGALLLSLLLGHHRPALSPPTPSGLLLCIYSVTPSSRGRGLPAQLPGISRPPQERPVLNTQ